MESERQKGQDGKKVICEEIEFSDEESYETEEIITGHKETGDEQEVEENNCEDANYSCVAFAEAAANEESVAEESVNGESAGERVQTENGLPSAEAEEENETSEGSNGNTEQKEPKDSAEKCSAESEGKGCDLKKIELEDCNGKEEKAAENNGGPVTDLDKKGEGKTLSPRSICAVAEKGCASFEEKRALQEFSNSSETKIQGCKKDLLFLSREEDRRAVAKKSEHKKSEHKKKENQKKRKFLPEEKILDGRYEKICKRKDTKAESIREEPKNSGEEPACDTEAEKALLPRSGKTPKGALQKAVVLALLVPLLVIQASSVFLAGARYSALFENALLSCLPEACPRALCYLLLSVPCLISCVFISIGAANVSYVKHPEHRYMNRKTEEFSYLLAALDVLNFLTVFPFLAGLSKNVFKNALAATNKTRIGFALCELLYMFFVAHTGYLGLQQWGATNMPKASNSGTKEVIAVILKRAKIVLTGILECCLFRLLLDASHRLHHNQKILKATAILAKEYAGAAHHSMRLYLSSK